MLNSDLRILLKINMFLKIQSFNISLINELDH